MKCLSNTIVELIVDNRAPMFWLFISNCLNICKGGKTEISDTGINEFLSFKVVVFFSSLGPSPPQYVGFGLRSVKKKKTGYAAAN